ncbi:MAG: hypothetical protein R3B57_03490 [Phycisphaerales bacterium]
MSRFASNLVARGVGLDSASSTLSARTDPGSPARAGHAPGPVAFRESEDEGDEAMGKHEPGSGDDEVKRESSDHPHSRATIPLDEDKEQPGVARLARAPEDEGDDTARTPVVLRAREPHDEPGEPGMDDVQRKAAGPGGIASGTTSVASSLRGKPEGGSTPSALAPAITGDTGFPGVPDKMSSKDRDPNAAGATSVEAPRGDDQAEGRSPTLAPVKKRVVEERVMIERTEHGRYLRPRLDRGEMIEASTTRATLPSGDDSDARSRDGTRSPMAPGPVVIEIGSLSVDLSDRAPPRRQAQVAIGFDEYRAQRSYAGEI